MWDPEQYQRFADERSRPFFDLLARVGVSEPAYVTDLGCGPGRLTATLAQRWPGAHVIGVDGSAEMIRAARARASVQPRLEFVLADIRQWQPERPVDVLVSNAVLQWVPDHLGLVRRWPGLLADQGWLAFQVPGNHDQPSHAILKRLAQSQRWRALLEGVELRRQACDPAVYLDELARAGCVVDAWETTYLHVLGGPDPVTQWYLGTGLRPVLSALAPDVAEEFVAEYRAGVQKAYPAAPYGTVLPFRRVFVVARKR